MSISTFKEAVDRVATHTEPVRELEGSSSLRVRRIRHSMDERCYVGGTSDYMIAMRLGGSSDVARYDGNRLDGSRAGIGGVCISGNEHEHGWHFPKPVDVFHLYVSRDRLEGMVEADLDADGRNLMIEPVFDAHDPFFHQLAITADRALRSSTRSDLLLLDQLNATLYGYVLQRYSNFGRALSHSEPVPATEDDRIRRVLEFIEENLANAIGVSELADIAAMSSSSLMRTFKSATGRSIAAHVKERRLQLAEEMLSGSRKSLARIAFETGFCDHSHFTRAFKTRFGVPPSDWRR